MGKPIEKERTNVAWKRSSRGKERNKERKVQEDRVFDGLSLFIEARAPEQSDLSLFSLFFFARPLARKRAPLFPMPHGQWSVSDQQNLLILYDGTPGLYLLLLLLFARFLLLASHLIPPQTPMLILVYSDYFSRIFCHLTRHLSPGPDDLTLRPENQLFKDRSSIPKYLTLKIQIVPIELL